MRTSPARLVGGLAIALALTLLAAFVIDRSVSSDSDRSSESSSASSNSDDASGEATIRIVDFAFDPPTLTVKAGTKITVINEDDAKHTVTSGKRDDPDGTFDVQVDGGATETFTAPAVGSYPYICTIHPGMKGTLEVTS